MVTVVWERQYDDSEFYAAVTTSDGYVVVAGRVNGVSGDDCDFLAMKIDPTDGELLWTYQNGTSGDDQFYGAATGSDGSVVLCGSTNGTWSGENEGGIDQAAIKLDSDGKEVWRFQAGSSSNDYLIDAAVGEGDSAYLAGSYSYGFFLMKVDIGGNMVWNWTDSSGNSVDVMKAVAISGEDDSVVLGGSTSRDWAGTNASSVDFAVIKIDWDGNEIWRWQDGNDYYDTVTSVIVEEGSIILGGYTYDYRTASDNGDADAVAIKMDADGNELWRWQAGTNGTDVIYDLVMENNSLVLAGFTDGDWSSDNKGSYDYLAVKLDASDGTEEALAWQSGTNGSDIMRAITSVSDGLMVAAGTVWSSFGSVMLLSTVSSTTGPATSPSPSPTLSPSPPPVILPASPSPTFSGTPSPATSPASPTPWPTFSPSPPHVIPPGSSSPAITPSPAPVTESGSWSPALAIALAASGTIVVALLALVLCHRRIRACLDTCYTTEEPASAVGPAPGNVSMDDGGHVVTGTLANRTSFSVHAADVVQEEKTDRSRRIMPSLVISARNISLPSINQGCSVEMSDEFPAYGAGVQQNAQHTPSCGVGSSDNLVGGDRTSGDLHKGTVADMQGTGISDTGIIPTVSTSESPLGAYDDSQSHDASADPVTIGVSTESDGDEMQASNSKGPSEDSDAHDGRASGSGSDLGVGLAQAILETAKELAQASSVPGVSAAATLVSVLVRLVVDHEGSGGAADGRLRWCRCIIVLLGKAAELLSKGGHALDESERVLLEDVRESIDDLIQLIQVYKSKNKMVRVITSSLFKRRQEELEATINLAVNRLQITLQLHGGHKLNAVGKDVKDMKHVLQVQQRTSQSSPSKVAEAAVAEIRRNRRQRRLEQLEIPEDELTLTDELLGKGGFGSVYMADYNGRNAAAKVVEIERDLGGDDGSDGQGDATDGQASDQSLERQKIQRRAFTRELEAMTRLRSPHTVHVYGAVTSRNDRLILVMELMSGGSLRAFLKRSSDPIEEEKAHRIVGEICAGMVFLHDQKTVHGDLKSANVLFDGYFRAKICDFGTSRWTQHTLSTGLATYTTNHSQITHMSLPWAAPEVLNKGERSFKSDVYSFGMVVWEVLTREVPWANETEPLDIYRRVVFKRERPDIPEGALADLADTVRSCWAANPSSRPSFTSILGDMKCKGWKTS